jgi:hypothetical protein
MKTIPLTQGKVAIVDDVDYEELSQYKWQATNSGRTWYAKRYLCYDEQGRHQSIKMHRQILGLKATEIADHVNGNGLDNQRENLRLCSQHQNSFNHKKSRRKTMSHFKGVSRVAGSTVTWRAYVHPNKTAIHLGCYPDESTAAKAYDEAAKFLFREFSALNFPGASWPEVRREVVQRLKKKGLVKPLLPSLSLSA